MYIWYGGVTRSRFRSPLLSEALYWEHGRLCNCHGRWFCRKPNTVFIPDGLNELGCCSLGNLSQTPHALGPSFPSVWCVWDFALGCCFQHQSEMQFAAPSICYVRQIKQSDPRRALRGCSLLVSPLQRVSWGRSNPIKPQLYLQIIP